MASVTSPVNSVGESVDSLITSAGTTGIMKGAVGARSVSGGDSNVAAVEVASQVDDAAFTPGTSTVIVIAGEADETATDSVDEGDAGALRMTLNRRLITAGHLVDDTAFGVATDYVSPIGALADETSPDSVDEGDIGALRMSLDRRLLVSSTIGVGPTDINIGGVAIVRNSDGTQWPLVALMTGHDGSNGQLSRIASTFKTIAAVAITAGAPAAVWTPTSGKKFRLMGYALSLSVAGSVILKDATTEILRTPLMLAGDGQPSPPMGNGILSAAANNVLNADVTATGSVSGFVFGTEES